VLSVTPGAVFDLKNHDGRERMIICHSSSKPLATFFELTSRFDTEGWNIIDTYSHMSEPFQLLTGKNRTLYYLRISPAKDGGSWISAFTVL
jgi:hypothetical protein